MTLNDWLAIGALAVSTLLAVWTGIRTIADKRAGITASEHSVRRDTVSDRDALIDQHQEDLKAAREDVRNAREDLRQASADIRAMRLELALEREYTQLLRDHIYRQGPPVPPDRPKGQ